MEHSRSELLLHPIRWRVIQALMGRELTTSDLKERLADVAVTTLYRQVAILADAGLLRVVAERQVRGAVERTYALDTEQPSVGKAGDLSRDELRSAFAGFSAGLVADVERYLARDRIDPEADKISFTQAALYLSDAELAQLGTAMGDLLRPLLESDRAGDDQADAGRRRMMLSTILLPGD